MSSKMDDKLYRIRHSYAHVLAQAVVDMFPEAVLGIGPPVNDGFYYDFELPRTLIPEDLEILEEKMRKIIKEDQTFEQYDEPPAKSLDFLNEIHQNLKVELAKEFLDEGEEQLSFYRNGDFVDMCEGPHVESTGKLPVDGFKLYTIAGAYWRGDEKRQMLQRIYGYGFASKKELKKHLAMVEEAKKRDHKVLGKKLGLFTFSKLVGSGLPLWTPKGTLVRNLLDEFVWELRKARGYEKVTIPHITKKDLYETSGHWQKFSNDLFKIITREGHEFVMKPMNCPHHTQIFDSEKRSYRDLPQRYAETTMVYRDEQSGELHGLSRVRSITQDDAHVFCRESQVKEEAMKIWDIIETFYGTLGFKLEMRLSMHDPEQMEKYLGTKEDWDQYVEQLREWLEERGMEYYEGVGEAAFYGPKIDFMGKDSLGREWQVATIQVDRNMPQRFDLSCVNEQGEDERIVMIHAAIMGSIERFSAVLIEHVAGAFPTWLSPVQCRVLPVSEKFLDYAENVEAVLREVGVRVEIDASDEKLGKKIRNAELEKIPYMLVVGEKEVAENTLAVRSYKTKKQEVQGLEDFKSAILEEIASRSL